MCTFWILNDAHHILKRVPIRALYSHAMIILICQPHSSTGIANCAHRVREIRTLSACPHDGTVHMTV